MPGWLLHTAPRLHPLRILARLAIIGTGVLWLANAYALDAVRLILPLMRAETALDGEFRILSLDLDQAGASPALRIRANLSRPLHVGQSVIYPMGWKPHTAGWYQAESNARGVLQTAVLVLVLVLIWPQRTLRELILRLLIALPLTALLVAIDVPLDLLGNLHDLVLRHADPNGIRPLFVWSKFLEGGGNLVMALASAALAIGFVHQLTSARYLRERTSDALSQAAPASHHLTLSTDEPAH